MTFWTFLYLACADDSNQPTSVNDLETTDEQTKPLETLGGLTLSPSSFTVLAGQQTWTFARFERENIPSDLEVTISDNPDGVDVRIEPNAPRELESSEIAILIDVASTTSVGGYTPTLTFEATNYEPTSSKFALEVASPQ